jgi:iron complex outermembrane receptor protein
MELSFASDYAYQTKQQFQITQTPDTVQPGYGIWNGTITLAKLNEGWKVSLLGKNLANTHYASLLTEAAGMVWRTVPRDNNRYFGISVRKDF